MGEGEEKGFEFGVAFVLWSGGSESSSPLDLDIVKEEEDFGERERFTRRRKDRVEEYFSSCQSLSLLFLLLWIKFHLVSHGEI